MSSKHQKIKKSPSIEHPKEPRVPFVTKQERVHSDSEEEKEKRKYTQLSRAIALRNVELKAMDERFIEVYDNYIELSKKLRDFAQSYVKLVERIFSELATE